MPSSGHLLLVWCTRRDDRNDEVQDHYVSFGDYNNRNEAAKLWQDAHVEYQKLLELDQMYSANICLVLESTDYEGQR